jgi:hypothetical protein
MRPFFTASSVSDHIEFVWCSDSTFFSQEEEAEVVCLHILEMVVGILHMGMLTVMYQCNHHLIYYCAKVVFEGTRTTTLSE